MTVAISKRSLSLSYCYGHGYECMASTSLCTIATPFSSRMFFLSNTAYSVAPDGVKTDWSNVTELLNRKKEKNGLIVYLSYCFYRTNVNDFFCLFLFCICSFVFVFLVCLFCLFFLLKPGPSYPVYTLHVQQHHSDSQMLLLKVCVLVSRLIAFKIKARY